MKKTKKLLFWQPANYISLPSYIVLLSNYLTWVFLFYISFLLIKKDINIFWQLFIATILSEIIEKFLKIKNFWKRPAVNGNNSIPNGLIKTWYTKGSFPSGHTTKAVFFLLFILQYHVFNPLMFLIVTVPLLLFRVLIGFHYPIDILGGIIIGGILWILASWIQFPAFANDFIRVIFNFVFFIS